MNQRARITAEARGYLSTVDRAPESLIKRVQEFSGGENGTPHGLMMLRGEITKSQYSACRWFDELYSRYLSALDLPRGIRTSTGERTDMGHAPDPFSPIGWKIVVKEQGWVNKFDSARMAGMECGEAKFREFWRVVIDNQPASNKLAVKEVAGTIEKHRTRMWKSRRVR